MTTSTSVGLGASPRGDSDVARSWVAFAVAMAVVMQLGPLVNLSSWIPKIQFNLWDWYIEDAAISFAYARHWASGEGLVPFPGGERVEGYSNPLWVALIALGYLVGVDGFLSSKLYGLIFGVLTVLFVWRLMREVVDDPRHPAVWLAPVFVGCNPQFGFWNASGLENCLFNALLAGGIWRTLVESRRGGLPLAAWAFLGLSITRPEAIMYAAVGGFAFMVLSWRHGRGLAPTVAWLLAFFVPFAVYHAVRYEYFAYAFPNTFYAKLGDRDFRPFQWSNPGWRYLRSYGYETGTVYSLPIFLMGLTGFEGWRRRLYLWSLAALTFILVYPGIEVFELIPFWPGDLWEPRWWSEARVWGLLALMVGLPIASVGNHAWMVRASAWTMTCLTLLFAMRAHGDWMRGFRWMSLCVVPMSILFGLGARDAAVALEKEWNRRRESVPWLRRALVNLFLAALLPGWIVHSGIFFNKRETGPYSVKKRVEYTSGIVDRLFLDGPIVNLDVDMGAHVYWSNHRIVDLAGLLDVPIAHHRFEQRAFTGEYIFREQRPHFAHVHGGWANKSKIPRFPEWEERYVELPGYPVSRRSVHPGNHIRRDLFLRDEWRGPDGRSVAFDEGVVLLGWKLVAEELSVGKAMYLEVAFSREEGAEPKDFRVVGLVSNAEGALFTFELPMAYDWVPPSEWRDGEVFLGRFAPMLPRELTPGSYELGFAVVGADGAPLRALPGAPKGTARGTPRAFRIGGRGGVPARFARGEARFSGAVTIGEPGSAERGAMASFQRAMGAAKAGRCIESERSWRHAWQHIPRAERWKEGRLAALRPQLAACWARKALEAETPSDQVTSVVRARFWDHHAPVVREVSTEFGERWMAEGLDARERADWESAYAAFDRAVRAKPSLSWARRYAEEARDHRLRLDADSVQEEVDARRKRLEELRARRKRENPVAKPDPATNDAKPVSKEGLFRLGRPPEDEDGDEHETSPDVEAEDAGSAGVE